MLGVRVTGIAEVVVTLNGIDKEIVKAARKDLKTALDPVVRKVRSNIPREAPLSGMNHMGRTGWKASGVKVNVRVNFSKKAQRRGSQLVSIVAGSKGLGGAAFEIADMAGRKSGGSTRSGRKMISELNNTYSRASRFVYPAAEAAMPYVENQLRDTIRKLSKEYNRKLKR
jgi:hypothetical protein